MSEKLFKEFLKIYESSLTCDPSSFIQSTIEKASKESVSLKEQKDDQNILRFVHNTFVELFVKHETNYILEKISSLLPPFCIKAGKGSYVASPYRYKDSVKVANTIPFGVWIENQKTFIWVPKQIIDFIHKKPSYKSLRVFSKQKIKDVELNDANSLAILFRTIWYKESFSYKYSEAGKTFGSYSLISLPIETKDGTKCRYYGLIDIPVKLPTSKIDESLRLLDNVIEKQFLTKMAKGQKRIKLKKMTVGNKKCKKYSLMKEIKQKHNFVVKK